ncbi:MAG: mechanosensitive ion channel [Lachnospiraceae bacterium]|nr:mechanosensitive ion channel [Candidatus Merdinaster equi]
MRYMSIVLDASAQQAAPAGIDINQDVLENIIPVDVNAFQKWLMDLPATLLNFGIKVLIAILILIVAKFVIKGIVKVMDKSLTKINADVGLVKFLNKTIRIILYILVIVGIAAYFGVGVASFVALLGTAGVAIGLSLKDNLSNIAAGVIILLTRPFRVGDYIKVIGKDCEGTVEDISLFYTTLMMADGNSVIIPNGQITNNSTLNLSKNPTRRVDLVVGISYNSDLKKAKKVIGDVITADEAYLSDKALDIFVDDLSDSSVNIGIHFFVNNANYWSAKWRVLESIKLALDENGISIPYPQMDVHMS